MDMYFFDVTDLLIYVERETSVSGIQRVSFEVIRRAVVHFGAENVRLSYWDKPQRKYVAIDAAFILDMEEFSADLLSAVFFGKKARSKKDTAPTLTRYRNRPLKYWGYSQLRNYHAFRGNARHFTRRGSSIEEWNKFKLREQTPQLERVSQMPCGAVADICSAGDQLIILGATWSIEGFAECMQKLKDESGLQIRQLVHDLIPLITPEHIAGGFANDFYVWLEALGGYCDQFIANSENTALDLQRFLDEIGHNQTIDVVPLAQKFDVIHSNKVSDFTKPFKSHLSGLQGLDQSIINITKMPFVLVVGTMESRKNIWRLAQAWQRLAEDHSIDVPRLVFAGKPGWHNGAFDMMMKATRNLGGWVQIVKRPSDTELGFLYENCQFTAMVSLYEGWGLPIGESLSFGKTAVVADNSSMPEVGGDMVEYCDALSIKSIHDACYKLIANPDHRRALEERIRNTKLRTWEDVADGFIKILEK
jgi:glycosyltransferase involved in cell wall biosynthesis